MIRQMEIIGFRFNRRAFSRRVTSRCDLMLWSNLLRNPWSRFAALTVCSCFVIYLKSMCSPTIHLLCHSNWLTGFYEGSIAFKLIKIQFCEAIMSLMRVGPRTHAKPKMESFMTIVESWELLTIVRKSSILDITEVLDRLDCLVINRVVACNS